MTVFLPWHSDWLTEVPVPIELFSKPTGKTRLRSDKQGFFGRAPAAKASVCLNSGPTRIDIRVMFYR